MMNIFLSPMAERQLMDLLDYLEHKWSEKSRKTFLDKLTASFNVIAHQPRSCPESEAFPNLFRCVVTKQTSFYYRISNHEIEVISISDNRQDPEKLREELL